MTLATGDTESVSLIGLRLADRFVVGRHLGAGGMGIVYEAFDEQRKEHVALKTLGRRDGTSVYNLKKEFRSLADLAHPNLVRLHELFSDGGRWFFTMARVEGEPFLEHVRGHETALRSAFAQLVRGVSAIHRAGKIHRDLKPGNVLVSAEGHVTILDFGLVQPAAHDIERSAELAGTPAYMAPEQLVAGGACAASDWYAVGVMLYEAIGNRLPFSGTTPEVLTAKLAAMPIPELGDVPPNLRDLADLAMELLKARPEERPSAETILARLGSAAGHVNEQPPISQRTTFVGREAELARLQAAYDEMARGATTTVWVEGPSGIGKSAFVEHFVEGLRWRAASAETVALFGRCYERESVPFKALDAVVDALSRHLARMDRVAAARLCPRDVPELLRVFPVLGGASDR